MSIETVGRSELSTMREEVERLREALAELWSYNKHRPGLYQTTIDKVTSALSNKLDEGKGTT